MSRVHIKNSTIWIMIFDGQCQRKMYWQILHILYISLENPNFWYAQSTINRILQILAKKMHYTFFLKWGEGGQGPFGGFQKKIWGRELWQFNCASTFNERPSSRDVVEKKIERISLEGELSWVAGRKNRRAPNRCSYLTFTHLSPLHSDFFFNSISAPFLNLLLSWDFSWSCVFSQLVKRSVLHGGQLPDLPHQLISSQDLILVTDFCFILFMRVIWIWCLADFIQILHFNSGYVASPTNGYPPAPHSAHSPGSALPYHQVPISSSPFISFSYLLFRSPQHMLPNPFPPFLQR